MELKAKPEMKKDIHPERIFFWNKMFWQEKENKAESSKIYKETNAFLKRNLNL